MPHGIWYIKWLGAAAGGISCFNAVILFDQFNLLLQVAFPIQKLAYFPSFVYLFPNIKAQVASQIRGKNTMSHKQLGHGDGLMQLVL